MLPVSFPQVAEVVSPTDLAEDFLAKATEYLNSGCREVWLVLPENRWIFVITPTQKLWFGRGDTVSSPVVLPELKIAVDELFA